MLTNTKINIILCLMVAGFLALILIRIEGAYKKSHEVPGVTRCVCPAPECKCVTPPVPPPSPSAKCEECEATTTALLEIANGSLAVPRRGTITETALVVDLTRVIGTGVVVEKGIKRSVFGICLSSADNGLCEIQESDLSPAGKLATRILRACR